MNEPWTARRRDELLTRVTRTTVLSGAAALVATAGISFGLASATTPLAAGDATAAAGTTATTTATTTAATTPSTTTSTGATTAVAPASGPAAATSAGS